MEKYVILGLTEAGAWVLLIGIALYAILITVFYLLNKAGSMCEIESLLMLNQELSSENKAMRKALNTDPNSNIKYAPKPPECPECKKVFLEKGACFYDYCPECGAFWGKG